MSNPTDRRRPELSRRASAHRRRKSRAFLQGPEALEARSLMAIILVTTTADTVDPSDDAISLREAIEVSNGTLPISSLSAAEQTRVQGGLVAPAPNQIIFAIPGGGIQTISVTSTLPEITSPVWIDGITQPGATFNDPVEKDVFLANLTLRIDGQGLAAALPGSKNNGISITSPNTTIDGLIITGFDDAAISITGAGSQGNFLYSNILGTLPDPAQGRFSVLDPTFHDPALSNGVGVYIAASNNRVGGNSPGLRNVVMNNEVGVKIETSFGTGNLLQGNFILDNLAQGVYVSSSNNTIGEALADGGNVISGNQAEGVLITHDPNLPTNDPFGLPQGNNLLGNLIGSDLGVRGGVRAKGIDARPNFLQGVLIDNSPKNTIGGPNDAARNVIAGNNGDGLSIQGANSTGNRILGNWVGFNIVNDLVSLFIPNQNGIVIAAPGNNVGGAGDGEGNVVSLNRANGVLITGALASNTSVQGNVIGLNPDGGSDFGNAFDGIRVDNAENVLIGGSTAGARNVVSGNNNGIVLFGAGTRDSRIQGNFVGTASDGVTDLGNAVNGVYVIDSSSNTIGGTASGQGNVISGNDRGVVIAGADVHDNKLYGNFIGTDLTGTAIINNEIDGVLITGGAFANAIGGTAPGQGNAIAFNAGNGVVIDSGEGNAILANSIHDNRLLGILLSNGANNDQQPPNLTAATLQAARVNVQGSLNAEPLKSYSLEFFANAERDPSGFGEGQRFLGSTNVTTDINGVANFSFDLQAIVASGEWISATATDAAGNTSEFSGSILAGPTQMQFASATYAVNESAGLLEVTINRTGGLGGTVAIAYATADGTATAGVQYAQASGTHTFLPGETAWTFTINILDTPSVGGSSTFTVNLSDPTNGATVGSPATTTVTITDDDVAELSFTTSTVSVNEFDGSVTLTVTRTSGVGAATVNYATANGTAIAGVNYQATSGTLNFAPGDVSESIVVPLLPDQTMTGNLTFSVGISAAAGASITSPSTVVVTVIDNDAAGALAFATPSVTAPAGATSATMTIVRTGGTTGTVTVVYATGEGSAVPGVDYVPTSGVLVFGPGETVKTFNVPILNPPGAVNSAFGLTLTSPTGGATLGAINTNHVNILRPIPPVKPPVVTAFTPINGAGGVTSVVIGFSEPLHIGSAQAVVNYGSFATSWGRDNIPNTRDDSNIAITAATYNPATNQVTLRLASPLTSSLRYMINLNQGASSAAGSGIMNTSRVLLAGDGQTAGTPYTGVIGTTTTTSRYSPPTSRYARTPVVYAARPSTSAVDSLARVGGFPRFGSFPAWARRR